MEILGVQEVQLSFNINHNNQNKFSDAKNH